MDTAVWLLKFFGVQAALDCLVRLAVAGLLGLAYVVWRCCCAGRGWLAGLGGRRPGGCQ